MIFNKSHLCIDFYLSAGIDYIAVNRILEFSPGVTMQTIKITILDDLGRPELEGEETFVVVLRMPIDASLGEPGVATITITDSISDCKFLNVLAST